MNCPVCGKEMKAGGLFVDGVMVRWIPEKDFRNNYMFKVAYSEMKLLKAKTSHWKRETKVPGAYYCAACKKVIGVFDIEE